MAGGISALACNFFAATAVLATALRFFLTAFLAADFIFRVRIAFFCIELFFEGMVIPFVAFTVSPVAEIEAVRCSYNSKLKPVQVIRLKVDRAV